MTSKKTEKWDGDDVEASNGKTATFCTGGLAAAGMALHRMKGGDEIGDQGRGTELDEIRVLISNNPTDTEYQGLGGFQREMEDGNRRWQRESSLVCQSPRIFCATLIIRIITRIIIS